MKIKFYVLIFILSFSSIFAQTNGLTNSEKIATAQSAIKANSTYFIENKGQWDDNVLFMAQSKSLKAWITKNSIVFVQHEKMSEEDFRNIDRIDKEPKKKKAHAVGLEFVKPSKVTSKPGVEGSTKFAFILGNDKSKHKSGCLQYSDVKIENIYEGIDMKYYFDNGELRYDFIVKPGANPELIEMEIKGSDKTYLKDGDVVMETSLEPLVKSGLKAFQNNKQTQVSCNFKLTGNKLKFELGEYDRTKELVIDPIVSIYFGGDGSSQNDISDIETDSEGNVYFVAYVNNSNYNHGLTGKYDIDYNGEADIVVGKINNSLDTVLWSTFFGSCKEDRARSIEIDNYNIYFAGWTEGWDFPITDSTAIKTSKNDTHSDGFFSVLNIEGTTLEYSTFYGATGNDIFNDMAISRGTGRVYLVGSTYNPTNFYKLHEITTQTYGYSYCQGTLVCLQPFTDSTGLNYTIKYSTLFGGDRESRISNIYLTTEINYPFFPYEHNGDIVHISGETRSDSTSFQPTDSAYKKNNDNRNNLVFLSSLYYNYLDSTIYIEYNTFFEICLVNFADYQVLPLIYQNNNFYFAGATADNIPTVNAFDDFKSAPREAFLSVINTQRSGQDALIYSSYFGNNDSSAIKDLEYIPECQRIIFSGYTNSQLPNFSGNLINQFSGTGSSELMLGIVDINNTTHHTLTDLAYISDNEHATYGNAVIRKYGSNHIYTAGGSGSNLAAHQISLSDICRCYCEENWVQLSIDENAQCENESQCPIKIQLDLNSIGNWRCYESYSYSDNYGSSQLISLNGIQVPLTIKSLCLPAGTEYQITVKLFKDGDSCVIVKNYICPCSCPPDVDSWISIDMENDPLTCDSNQCKVNVTWNIPDGYECFDMYKFDFGEPNEFDTEDPPDLPISTCLDNDEVLDFYITLVNSNNPNDSCVIHKHETCRICCFEEALTFEVLGPDTNCCYTFFFDQLDYPYECDTITHYKVIDMGDELPINSGWINNPHGGPFFDIYNYKLCNTSDSTQQFLFEFYTDDTYSDSSKMCSRLIALDPCIDTAAVCCDQIKLNIDLVKEGCPDGKCMIIQSWEIPDPRYDCFHYFIFEGNTLVFDPNNPPELPFADPCVEPDELISGTVSLLRFLGDPNPCIINYQAYCPVAEVRQGCNPDSCEDQWYYGALLEKPINEGDCQGCELNIYFKYRKTCGNWQDLQILGIDKHNPNTDSITCNCTNDEIFRIALDMLIKVNPMNFKPKWPPDSSGDTCSILWRVSLNSCWTDWFYDPMAPIVGKGKNPNLQSDPNEDPINQLWHIFRPCDSTCCARRFRVCRTCDTCVTYEDLGTLSGGISCDTVKYNNNLDCYFACDFFNDIHYSILPEFTEEHILIVNDNSEVGNIKLHYDNSKMTLIIENIESPSVDISLYNITGKLAVSKNEFIVKNKNFIEVDLTSLNSGVYMYRISGKNGLLTSGKIVIIR